MNNTCNILILTVWAVRKPEQIVGAKFEIWESLFPSVLKTSAEEVGWTIRALNSALDPAIASVLLRCCNSLTLL